MYGSLFFPGIFSGVVSLLFVQFTSGGPITRLNFSPFAIVTIGPIDTDSPRGFILPLGIAELSQFQKRLGR